MAEEKVLHELGNLLAVIAGQAELLLHQEPGADPADTRESLEAIRNAALRGRERLQEARGLTADSPPAAPSPPAPDERLRVLVVDDDLDVRDAVSALLRTAGHGVETAMDGDDAVARCRRQRFDCIITDLALPGLNGLTLSRIVKDRSPDTFVILLTGSGEDFEPAMVRAAGVDRLLYKPAGRTELLAAVAEARRLAQA